MWIKSRIFALILIVGTASLQGQSFDVYLDKRQFNLYCLQNNADSTKTRLEVYNRAYSVTASNRKDTLMLIANPKTVKDRVKLLATEHNLKSVKYRFRNNIYVIKQ